jgi:HK97 family phage major capsid protein
METLEIVKGVQASMEKMDAHNKEVLASLQESTKNNGEMSKDALAKAEASASEIQKISASILEMEQKLADNVKAGTASPKTLGQIVSKSESYKQFASGETRHMRVNANTITGQSGSPAVNSDTLVQADRLSGIVPGAFRSLRIKDILPVGTTTSNAVEYTRELAFTNAAAETAEGAQKPEATLTFELVTANVATIAHFIKVSKQVLEDSSALESYIDNRLRYGVELRYDNQLLNGNGTGQNISGITDSGNYTAFTPVTGENALDSINRAIQAVEVADYMATGIILNPADWHAIERLKVGTSDDRYIIGDPAAAMGARLWGLPVVISNNLASGKVVVGDFQNAYQVFDRSGVVVEMFEQDSDNVQKNLLTVRAEARGTLATFVPAAVQYGDLTQ